MIAGTFYIKTYGCQMNERDSDSAAAALRRAGWRIVDSEDDADVVIVNTCSVREKAEEKAVGKLQLLSRDRARGGRRQVIGAMGCMVQRMGRALEARAPGLDFALGTGRISALPGIVAAAWAGNGPAWDADKTADAPEYQPLLPGRRREWAFVTVLLGCDRRCSYCIVPDVRGAERSRTPADILDEIGALAAAGVREVCLLGQSVMSYGRRGRDVWENGPPSSRGYIEPFPRLIEAVAAAPGISRVRFTSGHPSGCTDELADAFKNIAGICPHLHIALQSGSDTILRRMNRGYTAGEFRGAVARLRSARPDLAVTTDAIVGFPGETREDFRSTRDFMDEIGFDNAFIFKYSPRPGTKAAEWPDDVPPAEKLLRNHELIRDQEARSARINARLVGVRELVLVEGPSHRNPARWSGRTLANKRAVFEPVPGLTPGDERVVLIEKTTAQTLYGSIQAKE